MTRILCVDLETVPCLVMGARVYGIDGDAPDAYEQIEGARRKETEGKSDTNFLKPFMHRIVGLGLVGLDTDTGDVELFSDSSEAEAELIRSFHVWLKGSPVLVGWNTLGFDLPVLRYRAMYHGIPLPRLYGPVNQKNWDKYDYRFGDMHYDLCDVLSGYGRSPSLKLKEAAALCGIPCKTEGEGEDVLALWKAGNHEQIRAYVEEDARVTARVFLRWQASRGRLERSAMEKLDEQLAAPAPALALA